MKNSENLQKKHYDKGISNYDKHYGDFWSELYRNRHIYQPLLKGLELKNKKVLDAMCGIGDTTKYLCNKGTILTGLDISQEAINLYKKKWPGVNTYCGSILHSNIPSETYDIAIVIGGLHHIHPHVKKAFLEIHRILKKGGLFLFVEPHRESILDKVRTCWYKRDRMFAINEMSLNMTKIKRILAGKFEFCQESYKGNIAYLVVFNSLILRIPLWSKFLYSPFFLLIEAFLEKVQTKRFSCFVLCRWKKPR